MASALGNPVEAQYFTAAPFLFGPNAAAKFSAKPRNPDHTPVPQDPEPNYLRAALKKTLDVTSGKSVVFDFQVHQPLGGINRLRLGVYAASANDHSQR